MIPPRSRRSSRRGSARSAATATARGTCAACSSSRPRSWRRCAAPVPPLPRAGGSAPRPARGGRRRAGAAPSRSCSCSLVVGGGAGGYLVFGQGLFPVAVASSSPSPTHVLHAGADTEPARADERLPEPTTTARPSGSELRDADAGADAAPRATSFAFYEVSVGPRDYTLFRINAAGEIVTRREASFDGFSYGARRTRAWSRRRCLLADARGRPQAAGRTCIPAVGRPSASARSTRAPTASVAPPT